MAAIRAGLVFETVSAIPEEDIDGALYWTELQSAGDVEMPPELLAVVSLAGPCAEARAMRRRFDRVFEDFAATDDREAIAGLGLSEQQFVNACRETVALVEQDWAVIEQVAEKLTTGARLSFDEVEELVHEADR